METNLNSTLNSTFKKKNLWVNFVAALLVVTIVGYLVGTRCFTAITEVRTVNLQANAVDYQSVLDEFENASFTVEGNKADFVGYQTIDASLLSQIDMLSASDIESIAACSIKYHFTYDVETNVVTIAAEATLENGEIILDEIKGVGFYNDKGEIDAVMNVDGDGVLLSEMRDAGMIQNCGWLSNIVKIAVAVVVVAVVVAVVATIIVSTAGMATPAVVAAGIGAVTLASAGTAATAAAITSTAIWVAAAAAGVGIVAYIADYYAGEGAFTLPRSGTATQSNENQEDYVNPYKYYKPLATATIATILAITMERCYYLAYLSSGNLMIHYELPLNYVEAYALLFITGYVEAADLGTGSLYTLVDNIILSDGLMDLASIIEQKKINEKYIGIYTKTETDAARLAYAAGGFFKGKPQSEIHDVRPGSGFYYHFHDFAHRIHVWYDLPV
jgi:hypothetical protein